MWTKPELLRVLRVRLKDDPFGLQIKERQPQGKRSGRRNAVVDEEQSPAHDPAGIDHDIIEAYTLCASERFGRGNSAGFSLAELAHPDDPPVLAQETVQSFAPWRYWEVTIDVDTDGTRTKTRYRLQHLRQHIIG